MWHANTSRHYLGPVLLVLLAAQPQRADACSCAPFPDDIDEAVAMAYAMADVIFLGDATAVRNNDLPMLPQREAEFSVRALWKGSIRDPVLVRTNVGEIACGYAFKKRESYLVFAYWDSQNKQLTTSFCDLTRTEDGAEDAIDVLNRLAKQDSMPAR